MHRVEQSRRHPGNDGSRTGLFNLFYTSLDWETHIVSGGLVGGVKRFVITGEVVRFQAKSKGQKIQTVKLPD